MFNFRKNEEGFSLLELSVAVGVAAIVATSGIVATTAFIGSAQDKRDSYTTNANSAITNAEASSSALGLPGDGGGSSLVYSHTISAPSAAEVYGSGTFNGVSGSYIVVGSPSVELIALVEAGGLTTLSGDFEYAGSLTDITVESAGYCLDVADGCDSNITSGPAVYVEIPGATVDGQNLYAKAVYSLTFNQ